MRYVNILVPPDIVPVKRTSPVKVKTRTVWREKPEGVPIDRGREWMSHDLFVQESHGERLRGMVSGSCLVHVIAATALAVFAFSQAHRLPLVKVTAPLVMPAMLSLVPVAQAAVAPPQARVRAAPRAVPQPPAAPPPPAAQEDTPSPLEAPASISPEPASPGPLGVSGGVDGGVAGGTVGGAVGGAATGAPSGTTGGGPLRVGAGIDPPRKIKDVKPLYPATALAGQQRGTVIIEATVGADGRVQEARVVHSVPALDHAALTAVRQWEFLPARLNGAAVAVIITVLVQFAIF